MTRPDKTLTLVAAMGRNRGIGKDGNMPWHLPAELKHFKATTLGKPVLMGRKTWQSIGRPLPGRQNIVISRNAGLPEQGFELCHSLEEAIGSAAGNEIMVIGGGQLYSQALPLASRMVLTMVDLEPESDTFFPEWDETDWKQVSRVALMADEANLHDCEIVEWLRRSGPVPLNPVANE